MSFGPLGPFFALAFGLMWGIVALLILFPSQIEAIFGELGTTNPLGFGYDDRASTPGAFKSSVPRTA
jgi:hypothetical protein